MFRPKWPIFTAILAILILCSCTAIVPSLASNTISVSPSPPVPLRIYTLADNGKTVDMINESTFYVKLSVNTGFHWDLMVSPGLKVLSKWSVMPAAQSCMEGYDMWEIQAIRPGVNKVTAYEYPPPKSMLPIIIAFNLHVDVTPYHGPPPPTPIPTITPTVKPLAATV